MTLSDDLQSSQLEERLEMSMLYDFYGALLKEKQQQIFEAYIMEDYSISEIAEEQGITRQGVHDAVKRVTKQLKEYEQKLGLLKRFERQKDLTRQLKEVLQKTGVSQNAPEWEQIFALLEQLLSE